MNEKRGGGGEKGDCYYHPKEVFVGVCPLCLYERLLDLLAKQAGNTTKGRTTTTIDNHNNKPPIVLLPKLFALTSLFNRFESSHRHRHHHRKSQNDVDDDDDCSSTLSQDDAFISIQFENNGAGSWEKNKVSLDHYNKPWNNNININNHNKEGSKSVIIEHAKPRAPSLRWRKTIGHLFHVMRWKRSNVCHVGSKKMEGVKARNGWIRTLTKRRGTKE